MFKQSRYGLGIFASALLAGHAAIAAAGIQNINNVTLTGSDVIQYEVIPVNALSVNPAADPNVLLQGAGLPANTGAPGGNIELFASSETATYASVVPAQPFQTVAPTTINGKLLTSFDISLSSLNGNDWFTTPSLTYDTAYAGSSTNNTLAQTWFNDFFNAFSFDATLTSVGLASQITTERANLYAAFLSQGGFQRLSDPNVSYVHQDDVTGTIEVGLAGNQDYLKTFVLSYIALTPSLDPFPTERIALGGAVNAMDVDASEIVKVTYNGQDPQYLYTFSGAQETGLTTTDPTESYGSNFPVQFQGVIPEPASFALLSVGSLLILKRDRQDTHA